MSGENIRSYDLTNRSHWDNYEDFPVSEWRLEVIEDNTRLGYLEWADHQRELAEEEPWEDDSIQFPRLIAEALAAGVWDNTSDDFRLMCASMDLEVSEVFELISRAQKKWDHIKSQI